jgi:hypothetical protein
LLIHAQTKIKELVAAAIALSSSSRAIRSITASTAPSTSVLTLPAFDALFALSPSLLPGGSAAALRLALGEPEGPATGLAAAENEGRETNGPAEQLFRLLAQRSAVREAVRAAVR